MRLDISDVLSEIGRQLPYEVHEPPLVDEDVECTAPVEGNITFTNSGGTLLIRGCVATRVALSCSRCCRYFEGPLSMQVDEQFELRRVSAGPRTLQTVTTVEEDVSPIAGKLIDGQTLDLTEMLRQYILLEEPTQPLPSLGGDGRCEQCHRTPEEVLADAGTEPADAMPVNPAFAELGKLLEPDPDG